MCSLSLGERGHRTPPLATWRCAADRCHDWYGALYGEVDMLFTRQQSPDAHRAGAYGKTWTVSTTASKLVVERTSE